MPGLSSKRVALSSSLGPGLKGEVVQVLRVVVEPKPGVKLRVVPQYELEVLWKVRSCTVALFALLTQLPRVSILGSSKIN